MSAGRTLDHRERSWRRASPAFAIRSHSWAAQLTFATSWTASVWSWCSSLTSGSYEPYRLSWRAQSFAPAWRRWCNPLVFSSGSFVRFDLWLLFIWIAAFAVFHSSILPSRETVLAHSALGFSFLAYWRRKQRMAAPLEGEHELCLALEKLLPFCEVAGSWRELSWLENDRLDCHLLWLSIA